MRRLADKLLGPLGRFAGMEVEETIVYKVTTGELLPQLKVAVGVKIEVLEP